MQTAVSQAFWIVIRLQLAVSIATGTLRLQLPLYGVCQIHMTSRQFTYPVFIRSTVITLVNFYYLFED